MKPCTSRLRVAKCCTPFIRQPLYKIPTEQVVVSEQGPNAKFPRTSRLGRRTSEDCLDLSVRRPCVVHHQNAARTPVADPVSTHTAPARCA
jgi:hypothetical protein